MERSELVEKLGLSDWDIDWDDDVAEGNLGECTPDWRNRDALIAIKKRMSRKNRIKTEIHELLHCHTSKLRDVDFAKSLVSDKAFRIIDRKISEREEELVLALEEVIYNILFDGK